MRVIYRRILSILERVASSHGVLDCVGENFGKLIKGSVCLDHLHNAFEGLLQHSSLIFPHLKSSLYGALNVFSRVDQPIGRCLVSWRIDFKIIEDSSLWVYLSVSETPDTFVLGLLEEEHLTRFDSESSEKVDLSFSLRESFKYPTVHSAVRLFNSLLNDRVDNTIWDELTLVDALRDDLTCLLVPLYLTLQQLSGRDIHESKLFGDDLSLSGST